MEGNGFNPGGRPKGSKNKTTIDIRKLRAECASLWGRTKAFNRLAAIANASDEGLFKVLEVMAKLLPRNVIEATGPTQIMILNPSIHDDAAVKVADALRVDGHDGPVTPELCRAKLHQLTQEKLNGNGSDVPTGGA